MTRRRHRAATAIGAPPPHVAKSRQRTASDEAMLNGQVGRYPVSAEAPRHALQTKPAAVRTVTEHFAVDRSFSHQPEARYDVLKHKASEVLDRAMSVLGMLEERHDTVVAKHGEAVPAMKQRRSLPTKTTRQRPRASRNGSRKKKNVVCEAETPLVSNLTLFQRYKMLSSEKPAGSSQLSAAGEQKETTAAHLSVGEAGKEQGSNARALRAFKKVAGISRGTSAAKSKKQGRAERLTSSSQRAGSVDVRKKSKIERSISGGGFSECAHDDGMPDKSAGFEPETIPIAAENDEDRQSTGQEGAGEDSHRSFLSPDNFASSAMRVDHNQRLSAQGDGFNGKAQSDHLPLEILSSIRRKGIEGSVDAAALPEPSRDPPVYNVSMMSASPSPEPTLSARVQMPVVHKGARTVPEPVLSAHVQTPVARNGGRLVTIASPSPRQFPRSDPGPWRTFSASSYHSLRDFGVDNDALEPPRPSRSKSPMLAPAMPRGAFSTSTTPSLPQPAIRPRESYALSQHTSQMRKYQLPNALHILPSGCGKMKYSRDDALTDDVVTSAIADLQQELDANAWSVGLHRAEWNIAESELSSSKEDTEFRSVGGNSDSECLVEDALDLDVNTSVSSPRRRRTGGYRETDVGSVSASYSESEDCSSQELGESSASQSNINRSSICNSSSSSSGSNDEDSDSYSVAYEVGKNPSLKSISRGYGKKESRSKGKTDGCTKSLSSSLKKELALVLQLPNTDGPPVAAEPVDLSPYPNGEDLLTAGVDVDLSVGNESQSEIENKVVVFYSKLSEAALFWMPYGSEGVREERTDRMIPIGHITSLDLRGQEVAVEPDASPQHSWRLVCRSRTGAAALVRSIRWLMEHFGLRTKMQCPGGSTGAHYRIVAVADVVVKRTGLRLWMDGFEATVFVGGSSVRCYRASVFFSEDALMWRKMHPRRSAVCMGIPLSEVGSIRVGRQTKALQAHATDGLAEGRFISILSRKRRKGRNSDHELNLCVASPDQVHELLEGLKLLLKQSRGSGSIENKTRKVKNADERGFIINENSRQSHNWATLRSKRHALVSHSPSMRKAVDLAVERSLMSQQRSRQNVNSDNEEHRDDGHRGWKAVRSKKRAIVSRSPSMRKVIEFAVERARHSRRDGSGGGGDASEDRKNNHGGWKVVRSKKRAIVSRSPSMRKVVKFAVEQSRRSRHDGSGDGGHMARSSSVESEVDSAANPHTAEEKGINDDDRASGEGEESRQEQNSDGAMLGLSKKEAAEDMRGKSVQKTETSPADASGLPLHFQKVLLKKQEETRQILREKAEKGEQDTEKDEMRKGEKMPMSLKSPHPGKKRSLFANFARALIRTRGSPPKPPPSDPPSFALSRSYVESSMPGIKGKLDMEGVRALDTFLKGCLSHAYTPFVVEEWSQDRSSAAKGGHNSRRHGRVRQRNQYVSPSGLLHLSADGSILHPFVDERPKDQVKLKRVVKVECGKSTLDLQQYHDSPDECCLCIVDDQSALSLVFGKNDAARAKECYHGLKAAVRLSCDKAGRAALKSHVQLAMDELSQQHRGRRSPRLRRY